MKVSESSQKTTIPGVLNVRRFVDESGKLAGDMIYDVQRGIDNSNTIVDPMDILRRKKLGHNESFDLLRPLFKKGKFVGKKVSTMDSQKLAKESLDSLDETQKRTLNPHTYPVGIERSLNEDRVKMVAELRGL